MKKYQKEKSNFLEPETREHINCFFIMIKKKIADINFRKRIRKFL